MVELRSEIIRRLEEYDLTNTKFFTDYGVEKFSNLFESSFSLAYHNAMCDSMIVSESELVPVDDFYTLYDLGPYVEQKVRQFLKDKDGYLKDISVELPEEVENPSDRFLNSSDSSINLGNMSEPGPDAEEEAIVQRIKNLACVYSAGIRNGEFRVGYYVAE
ncbi:hypothetical protein AKJ40_01340 [candidate division MSBL1 archaeon SCGC-AAA259M10]|uniref:Uncharacterized protein n=1 Tax=candidate division MSBL1 archaeon SCGC-AAA259M10 TaxID=1698270 RepID=A0A133V1V8_9EURY|nr:hypothetical protein AKJ40_01340 [candidate division MSBL1 archaeon SCGC-AAA259M10]